MFPSVMPIHPPYARRLARDSAILWVLLRAVAVALTKGVLVPVAVSLIVVGAVVSLVWLDGRRFHEHVFHANLGTPVGLGVAIVATTAGGLELVAMILTRVLAA